MRWVRPINCEQFSRSNPFFTLLGHLPCRGSDPVVRTRLFDSPASPGPQRSLTGISSQRRVKHTGSHRLLTSPHLPRRTLLVQHVVIAMLRKYHRWLQRRWLFVTPIWTLNLFTGGSGIITAHEGVSRLEAQFQTPLFDGQFHGEIPGECLRHRRVVSTNQVSLRPNLLYRSRNDSLVLG